ncbi:hypothetical protein [Lysinibacillus sp. NPDC093216]|uniref:hypothetical protein n=1 Tax=Lysinibacillus sp. NPDC093216 TaxID=3390576 RepID=UPI003CFE4162
MNINIEKDSKGNFNPDLYYILKNIPEDILFNKEHNKRLPLGIYNVSTLRVYNAFDTLLESLNDAKVNIEKLSEKHIELLDSLMAFYDDVYSIMKCFFPKEKVKKNIIFNDKWLMNIDTSTKKIILNFKSEIAPFREPVASIINRVKHDQARYCHIEAKTIRGTIKGFYVEGVNSEGTIVPDINIHPLFGEKYTAISYNRDIKIRFIDFIIVNSIVVKYINKLISSHYGKIIKLNRENGSDNDSLLKLSNMCSTIPNNYFPDEYQKEIPQIDLKESIDFRSKAYANYSQKIIPINKYSIKTTMQADGVSDSWALPYF